MESSTNIDEHRFLVAVETEIFEKGKTTKRCPRCGNEIILEIVGTACTVKCKTHNCIEASFRGI